MAAVEKILEKLLLPLDSFWAIKDVQVNEEKEEIEVMLDYRLPYIEASEKRYSIYDHRPKRRWRHLDLWQYKTYISAGLPRYKDEKGCYHTIEIPWAEPSEQMTVLLEKKF